MQDDSVARTVDALNPYASVAVGYDTNTYRLDDDAPKIGQDRADPYAQASAGFAAELRSGQQRFELGAEVNHTSFAEHDELDYTGSKANALWYWRASDVVSGTLGARHSRTLRDFANQETLDRFRDIRMENQALASVDVNLPGHWRLGLRGDVADVAFSETDRLDLLRTTVGTSLEFVSGSGNTVGLDAELVQGDYDDNPSADFDEYTVGPTVEWRLTDRTAIEAMAGYSGRQYDDPERDDYDGATGRVVLRYNEGARTRFRATVYRELSNLGDEVAEFAIVDGLRFEPAWQLRENLDLRVVAAVERRDFQRDPDSDFDPLPLAGHRRDDVYTTGGYLDWKLRRNLTLSIGADIQRRDSTRELRDYDFQRVEVRIAGRL